LGTQLGNISIAVTLIALSLGYIVCHLANRQEGKARVLGLGIGFVIIVTSIIVLLSSFLNKPKPCGSKYYPKIPPASMQLPGRATFKNQSSFPATEDIKR